MRIPSRVARKNTSTSPTKVVWTFWTFFRRWTWKRLESQSNNSPPHKSSWSTLLPTKPGSRLYNLPSWNWATMPTPSHLVAGARKPFNNFFDEVSFLAQKNFDNRFPKIQGVTVLPSVWFVQLWPRFAWQRGQIIYVVNCRLRLCLHPFGFQTFPTTTGLKTCFLAGWTLTLATLAFLPALVHLQRILSAEHHLWSDFGGLKNPGTSNFKILRHPNSIFQKYPFVGPPKHPLPQPNDYSLSLGCKNLSCNHKQIRLQTHPKSSCFCFKKARIKFFGWGFHQRKSPEIWTLTLGSCKSHTITTTHHWPAPGLQGRNCTTRVTPKHGFYYMKSIGTLSESNPQSKRYDVNRCGWRKILNIGVGPVHLSMNIPRLDVNQPLKKIAHTLMKQSHKQIKQFWHVWVGSNSLSTKTKGGRPNLGFAIKNIAMWVLEACAPPLMNFAYSHLHTSYHPNFITTTLEVNKWNHHSYHQWLKMINKKELGLIPPLQSFP